MTITLGTTLHLALSSVDVDTTLKEADSFGSNTPPKPRALVSVRTDNSFSATPFSCTKSRGPRPPHPTTPKPKVAVTRSTLEDFLLMENSVRRGSMDALPSDQLADSSGHESCSMTRGMFQRHTRHIHSLIQSSEPDIYLITFDRNSPVRTAKRWRDRPRSLFR